MASYPRLNRGDMRNKIRNLTAIESTNIITDAHINDLINQELHSLINNQKYDEAIIHLNEFIKEDKMNWNAWHLLGQAYRFNGDLDNAITCHEKAYSLNKELPSILLALGIAHQLNKNYIAALKALERAIQLDELYTIAYNSLALTYKRIGDLDRSLEAFENGINTIAKKFYLTLTNSKQNKIYKHQDIEGRRRNSSRRDGENCLRQRFKALLWMHD